MDARKVSLTEIFQQLHCNADGLTRAEAAARLSQYGSNRLVFHRTRSPILMLLQQFTSLFPLLLLISAGLSWWADTLSPGQGYELIAAALLVVVILNSLVSFFQNYKVEKLMVAFLDYIPRSVNVLRERETIQIDADDLVPGDVLLVQEGDKFSADGIVINANQLLVDESIISGESLPVEKLGCTETVTDPNRVFSGTTVLKGSAQVLVNKTGRTTRIGAISDLSQQVRSDLTPMQKELQNFVRKITWLALAIGGIFFLTGFLIGNSFWTNLIFAIGIIVANVPEGLLPTVTLALSQASLRMGKRNAVVKDILSVETLGSTTVICTDKTGTLTQNRLHVETLYLDFQEVDNNDTARLRQNRACLPLQEIMALCNDAVTTVNENNHSRISGDPTEVALARYVDQLDGYDNIRNRFSREHSREFDPETRLMAVTYRTQGGTLYMTVKGATEVIISQCSQIHSEGLVRTLNDSEKQSLYGKATSYANDGLRVLALAYAVVEQVDAKPEDLVFVGLVAFVDPPRREVPAAVAACKSAGIRVLVMSGDKAETVAYIAKRLGIVEDPQVIEGEQLAQMNNRQMVEALQNPNLIFARIAPEQKLNIVDALKAMDEVVAMTGDGVNDAPALKRADIGVAMGRRGTDVAKEASDIILLDDNFATIVRAIEEGRAVYDNIKKFITYILTSNIPEILPFIAYVLLPIPLPITVIQILSIDLITDMLPAIGLGNEPPESDIMHRPPRRHDERMVSYKTFIRSYGIIGPAEALLSFGAFFTVLLTGGWQYGERLEAGLSLHAQASAAFLATIIFCQLGNVMACRSNRQSAFSDLLRFNPWISTGLLLEVVFIFSIIYTPAFHNFFNTSPFPVQIWLLIGTTPLLIFFIEELRKWLVRRGITLLEV